MADFDYVPVGAIVALGRSLSPDNQNFMLCQGQELDATAYSELYVAIGNIYGGNPDNQTFNLPDFRGYFLRGADHQADVDPNVSARIREAGSTAETGGVGTSQDFATARPSNPLICSVDLPTGTTRQHGETRGGVMREGGDKRINACTEGGDPDTRPINVYVEYYIKVQS